MMFCRNILWQQHPSWSQDGPEGSNSVMVTHICVRADSLQVAIDIAGSGRLTFPYPRDFDTGILNITIFLFSYVTGLNLTISNGTSAGWVNASTAEPEEFDCGRTTKQGWQNAGCEEIMDQEPGSTVKHVNWAWPDCLVGNGEGEGFRGVYNVSRRPFLLLVPLSARVPSSVEKGKSGR